MAGRLIFGCIVTREDRSWKNEIHFYFSHQCARERMWGLESEAVGLGFPLYLLPLAVWPFNLRNLNFLICKMGILMLLTLPGCGDWIRQWWWEPGTSWAVEGSYWDDFREVEPLTHLCGGTALHLCHFLETRKEGTSLTQVFWQMSSGLVLRNEGGS